MVDGRTAERPGRQQQGRAQRIYRWDPSDWITQRHHGLGGSGDTDQLPRDLNTDGVKQWRKTRGRSCGASSGEGGQCHRDTVSGHRDILVHAAGARAVLSTDGWTGRLDTRGGQAPSATKASCPVLALPLRHTLATQRDKEGGHGRDRMSHGTVL